MTWIGDIEMLDSATMRRILRAIQQRALAKQDVTIAALARDLNRSTSVVARHCRALRDAELIAYEDRTISTIRVREWL